MFDRPVDAPQNLLERQILIEAVGRTSIEAVLEDARLTRPFQQFGERRPATTSDHPVGPSQDCLDFVLAEASHAA